MKVNAAERFLAHGKSTSTILDRRDQNPPGVIFHFEGNEDIRQTGTQVIWTTPWGMAPQFLAIEIMDFLNPDKAETELIQRRWRAGTFKTRERLMRIVNQRIEALKKDRTVFANVNT